MLHKILPFLVIQLIPLVVWVYLLKKKGISIDWRLVISYFIFGSWFGMMGELFLFQVIDWIFHTPIWEYRVLPIHNGITSSFGPIMWGLASVYICFHSKYSLLTSKSKNLATSILLESGFLLVLELCFNFIAYAIFKDYFFYYFVPDLWHWSSLTNLPFWWVGYQFMVKASTVLYKEEKLNFCLAVFIIIVIFAYQ